MPKTTAYRIVIAKAADKVAEEVMALLEAGWELHGDLKVDTSVLSTGVSKYAGIDYNILLTVEELDGINTPSTQSVTL